MLVLAAAVCIFCTAGAQEGTGAYINLGESELFSEADLQAAVDTVLDEFNGWEGCEMHYMEYAGDGPSLKELEYVKEHYEEGYDEAAVILSAFRSPKEAYGSWEADREYAWSWCAARKDKGEWELINWGFAESYLGSEQFTEEEMASALQTITAELEKMEGTRFYFAKYEGDEYSQSELEYVNSLERGAFDECTVFTVWFQSPKEEYGAWSPDTLYTWSFYLARADKGDWQIVTFGY